MAGNTEIELKLLLSKDDLKRLLASPLMTGLLRENSMRRRRLNSSYYDTEELSFKQQGIAYRVRSKGDRTYEATVKARIASASGLSERLELNLPLKSARPQLQGFAALGLGYELSELAANGVQKLFTVSVMRTTYILDLPDAVIELAADHGKILANTKSTLWQAAQAQKRVDATEEPIDEVELELLEGDKNALLRLAAQISEAVPVFVEERSKFARGLALCGIEADESASKAFFGRGTVSEEINRAVALHGDALLRLQDELRFGGANNNGHEDMCSSCESQEEQRFEEVKPKLLKRLKRELLALRSYAAMTELAETTSFELFLSAVSRAQALYSLRAPFDRLVAEGCLSVRSPLRRSILKQLQLEEEALVQEAVKGRLTALLFALRSSVATLTAEQEIGGAVKAQLKLWNKRLAETQEPAERLLLLESCYALARSCEGKGFAKQAAEYKRQRRELTKARERELWKQFLLELCERSTGKLTHRDAGLLLGYCLSKENKL
jgi:hypothetical protein